MSNELEHLADDMRAADAADELRAGKPGDTAAPGDARSRVERELSPAEAWSQVPAVFGGVLSRWFPEMKDIYNQQANLEWGRAMVPVAERYGWTADKFFAWLGPWFMLAMATEALVTPTVIAFKVRIEAARAAQAAARQDKPAEPRPQA